MAQIIGFEKYRRARRSGSEGGAEPRAESRARPTSRTQYADGGFVAIGEVSALILRRLTE